MTKQSPAQRKAAQAAVDHEEAVEAERERRRAVRERRADKVRAIEDAVAAEERRQKIALVRSSLGLTKDGAKEGARELAATVWDGCAIMLLVVAFLAVGLNVLSAVMPPGLIQIAYPLFAFGVVVWFFFGESIVAWLRTQLTNILKR